MRDAFGGLVNLVIIVVFMLLVSGYLAFNVNYTKAFRVKNKIISTIEQYEGICDLPNGPCMTKISDYMNQLGYDKTLKFNLDGYTCTMGFCYKTECKQSGDGIVDEDNGSIIYKVVTRIDVNIPIINNIMPDLRLFQITGDTKSIKLTKDNKKFCS